MGKTVYNCVWWDNMPDISRRKTHVDYGKINNTTIVLGGGLMAAAVTTYLALEGFGVSMISCAVFT